MANYEAYARTNYFKVADMEGLRKATQDWPVSLEPHSKNKDFYCFIANEEWPDETVDFETDEIIQCNVERDILPFLEPEQIFIITEIGHEKMRYLHGGASAFNTSTKEYIHISTNEIYELAKLKWGIEPTLAEY